MDRNKSLCERLVVVGFCRQGLGRYHGAPKWCPSPEAEVKKSCCVHGMPTFPHWHRWVFFVVLLGIVIILVMLSDIVIFLLCYQTSWYFLLSCHLSWCFLLFCQTTWYFCCCLITHRDILCCVVRHRNTFVLLPDIVIFLMLSFQTSWYVLLCC